MNFKNQKPLDYFLNGIFKSYFEHVPNVNKITQALIDNKVIEKQEDILNDHVAFRTFGVPNLGIASLEKIFIHFGYVKKDFYSFKEKKLNAYWYSPPSIDYPRVFISELRVNDLSKEAQDIIKKYTQNITQDPVEVLSFKDTDSIIDFFYKPLWVLPSYEDYKTLLDESEYAAWVIYNRYYLNHYTLSIHEFPKGYNTLEEFNTFLKGIGIKLNTAGGEVKESKDGLLLQSSSVAEKMKVTFSCGTESQIFGSYVEFAQRKILPQYENVSKEEINASHRRDGFETSNADKIFESTFQSQDK